MVKRTTITALAIVVILLFTAIPAFGATSDYKVFADGDEVIFTDQKPIEQDQRILTPIRFPMEAIGVNVEWNQDNQTATLTKGGITAVFTIGSTEYTVNGVVNTMDTAPIALNGRTLFPIRFAAEAFDAIATWDGYRGIVSINTREFMETVPKPRIYKMPEDAEKEQWMTNNHILMALKGTDKVMHTRIQCVNQEALNTNRLGWELDGFYCDHEISWLKVYGSDGNYQVQPGEVLIFDIWVCYQDDNHGMKNYVLAYDDYTYVVPDYTQWQQKC